MVNGRGSRLAVPHHFASLISNPKLCSSVTVSSSVRARPTFSCSLNQMRHHLGREYHPIRHLGNRDTLFHFPLRFRPAENLSISRTAARLSRVRQVWVPDRTHAALLQVFLKKISYPALVIATHLAVGKLLVEPKFSAWIVDQRLLQRLGLGKWDHRIGGRMSDENGQGSVADIFCR